MRLIDAGTARSVIAGCLALSLAASVCAYGAAPKLLLPDGGGAQSAIWMTNGNVLITSHGGVLKFWQMPEGRYLKTEVGGPLAVLVNGEREIAVAVGGGAELRKIDTGEVLHRIEAFPVDPNHSEVRPVAFSPDGKYAVFARPFSSDQVRVVEFSSGVTVKELQAGFAKTAPSAVFSPDSKWLAGLFSQNWTDVWQTSDWERTARLEIDGMVAAFSPSSQRLAVGFRPKLLPGNFSTGPVTLVTFEPAGPANIQWMEGGPDGFSVTATRGVAWSPNGAVLGVVNNGLELRVLGAGFGLFPKPRLGGIGNSLSGHGMAFSPDGQELAIADALVEIWNTTSGEGRRLAPINDLMDYAVSKDGALAAVADSLVPARVLALTNQSTLQTLPADERKIMAVAFSPRTNIVVAGGSYTSFQRPTVFAWRLGTEGPPSELPGSEQTTGLKFSADGNWVLALGNGSRVARLTDDLVFEEVRGFPSAQYGDISADGSLVVLGSSSIISGEIIMYDRSTRNAKWSLWGNSNKVQVVRFSPDGKKVAAGGGVSYGQPARPVDSDITVYDSFSGELIARLRGHEGEVSGLVFAADSEHLLSSSLDRTFRVWRVSEQKLVKTLLDEPWGASNLQLTSDGNALFYIRGDGNLMSLDLTGAFDAGPRLEVQAENGIVLRWDAGGGTVLERSMILGAGANWMEETNIISKGEGNFEFAVPAAGEGGFFRLRQ